MSRLRAGFVLTAVLLAGCSRHASVAASAAPVTYEVYALRYATLPGFPTRALVAGADSSRRTDIAMMVWLLRGSNGRNVLVDAGFYRDKFMRQWKPRDYVRPSEVLAKVGLKPENIDDIIVSHVHWDHMDGADLFPRARIWIQRDEFTHHLDSAGTVRDRAVDADDAKMLAQLAREGRVELVPGDSTEILPGITVFTGGKHTYASEYAAVRAPHGTVIVASDNVYLYENLDRRVPIAQTLDRASNLAAQERMLRLASDRRLIVPGHDAEVFARFPSPGNGVAKIE